MSNIEQQMISKVIELGDYTSISENQITLRYVNGKHKRALRFIQDFMLKYGKVPSKQVFKKKFPDYTLLKDISESLDYYCDEVRMKVKHNEIADSIEDVSELIGNLETEEAFKLLVSLVNKVTNDFTKSDRVELNKNTKRRKEQYLERSKSGGVTGLPSGIDRLDQILSGFNDEELIILIAYTSMGKRQSYKGVA